MSIAWDYLTPLQQAQLQQTRPDVFRSPDNCKHCGALLVNDYGEVMCLSCGREHDDNGDLLEHPDPYVIRGTYGVQMGGGRHNKFKRRK